VSFFLPTGVRSFFSFEGQRAFAKTPRRRDATPRFLMFDAYYFSLLLGLREGRLGDANRLEAQSFFDAYPDNYRAQAELIAGLLVDSELRRLQIGIGDRADIERQMVLLLDLTSTTRLSGHGDQLLNRYAVAGFDVLQDGIMPPDNLEDFLVAYHALWAGKDPAE